MAKITENFLMQRRLNGLDVYQPASDLAPGDLSDMQNCYSYDGELYSRWGKQACFVTPPSSSPNYAVTEFVRSDGSTVVVFCNSGKLYYSIVGTPPLSYYEIKINGNSFSLASTNVQMKKAGKYLYVVDGAVAFTNLVIDGTNNQKVTSVSWTFTQADINKQITITGGTGFTQGTYTIASVSGGAAVLNAAVGATGSTGGVGTLVGPLYRVNVNADGSTTAAVVTALSVPNAPSASLTNQVIDAMTSASGWASFPQLSWPGGTTVTNANAETINSSSAQQFVGGQTLSTSQMPNNWLSGGDTLGFQASSVGGQEVLMDGGAGPEWVDWDYPTPTYPSTGGPAGGSANTINNARVWIVGATAHSTDGGKFQLIVYPEAVVGGGSVVQYTDLVYTLSTNTLTSAANPFSSGDVGKVITIVSNSGGWVPGNYIVESVSGTTATMHLTPGPATANATAGVGTKNLDSGGTTNQITNAGGSGNANNTTLSNPPSAITGYANGSSTQLITPGGNNTPFANVFSFSQLGTDPQYMKYRIYGPAANSHIGVNSPSFKVVDVRLYAAALNGKLHISANNVTGGWCLGGVWMRKDYTGIPTTFAATLKIVSSGTTSVVPPHREHSFRRRWLGRFSTSRRQAAASRKGITSSQPSIRVTLRMPP